MGFMQSPLQVQSQANWNAMQMQAGQDYRNGCFVLQPFITVDEVIAHHRGRGNVYGDRSIPLLIAEIDRLRALLPKPTPAYHWLGAEGDPTANAY